MWPERTMEQKQRDLAETRANEEFPACELVSDFLYCLGEDLSHRDGDPHAASDELLTEFLTAVRQLTGSEGVKRAKTMMILYREVYVWSQELDEVATMKLKLEVERHLEAIKKEVE